MEGMFETRSYTKGRLRLSTLLAIPALPSTGRIDAKAGAVATLTAGA